MYKITFNTEQYEEKDGKKIYLWGRWAQSETLLHEMLHALKQHGRGKAPYKGGFNSHNAEFCKKAMELGLYVVPVVGCHYAVADSGSPFGILMKELGIQRPEDIPSDKKAKKDWFENRPKKGSSSLTKWTCGCQNVRVGTKEFHATCDLCHNPFVPAETKVTAMLGMIQFDIGSQVDGVFDNGEIINPWDDPNDLTTYMEPYRNDS